MGGALPSHSQHCAPSSHPLTHPHTPLAMPPTHSPAAVMVKKVGESRVQVPKGCSCLGTPPRRQARCAEKGLDLGLQGAFLLSRVCCPPLPNPARSRDPASCSLVRGLWLPPGGHGTPQPNPARTADSSLPNVPPLHLGPGPEPHHRGAWGRVAALVSGAVPSMRG